MKTMKKFWRYFILFVLLFLWVSGLMYLGTMNINNKEEKVNNYEDVSKVNVTATETNI